MILDNNKIDMTIKNQYEQELFKAQIQLINQYVIQETGTFILKNDIESTLIREYVENYLKLHIENIIKTEKDKRPFPSTSPQLLKNITEIKGIVRKTTEKLLKKKE